MSWRVHLINTAALRSKLQYKFWRGRNIHDKNLQEAPGNKTHKTHPTPRRALSPVLFLISHFFFYGFTTVLSEINIVSRFVFCNLRCICFYRISLLYSIWRLWDAALWFLSMVHCFKSQIVSHLSENNIQSILVTFQFENITSIWQVVEIIQRHPAYASPNFPVGCI